jgi:hypothetical protein
VRHHHLLRRHSCKFHRPSFRSSSRVILLGTDSAMIRDMLVDSADVNGAVHFL